MQKLDKCSNCNKGGVWTDSISGFCRPCEIKTKKRWGDLGMKVDSPSTGDTKPTYG